MLHQMTIEKKFMLIIALALLLFMVQGVLSFHSISRLGKHTEATHQMTQEMLDSLQTEVSPPAAQQIERFREEAQNRHENALQQVRATQRILLLVPQIGIVLLITIAFLFVRELRAATERECDDG